MCDYEPFLFFDDCHYATEFDLWGPLLNTMHHFFFFFFLLASVSFA